MKAALYQFNPRVGDGRSNLDKLRRAIHQAKQSGVELIVFPELAICGYPPRDLLDRSGFVRDQVALVNELAEDAEGIAVCCGLVTENEEPTGAPYRNALAFLRDGRVERLYYKQLLPNYDVFDEARYFEAGDGPVVVEVSGKRVGLTVCEDVWNFPGFVPRPYRRQPLDGYRGVSLLVNIAASPFHLGKPDARRDLMRRVASAVRAPVLFCNQVGANDELIFDGCSLAVGADGKILAEGPAFSEGLVTVDVSVPVPVASSWPVESAAWLVEAITLGIRDYFRKTGHQTACLGVSGGIDSAVVAALAVRALDASRVTGLSLPSRFSSPGTQSDARAVCEKLGMGFHEIPLEPVHAPFLAQWEKTFGEPLEGVAAENVQPRLRMAWLMAYANRGGALLLNTSNKSEVAMGYATLYGDSAGALAPIADITKGQVYAIARYLNAEREVIPRTTIERAPTAELREGQKDEDSLPPYPVLDELVRQVIEQGRSADELPGDPRDLARFARLYATSEYKRGQLPPALRVSPRAFGVGRRVPIVKA